MHDNQLIGSMDTFCRFIWDNEKSQTTLCKNGGKRPTWDFFKEIELQEHVEVDSEEESIKRLDINSELDIEIFSAGMISDTLLGTASIRISALIVAAEDGKEDWYSIFHLNNVAGMIKLHTKFSPDVSKAIPFIENQDLNEE